MDELELLKEIAGRFPPSRRGKIIRNSWTMRTCLATARLIAHGDVVGESGIESCFYSCAEISSNISAIIVQPFTAAICGLHGDFQYTPDALVKTADDIIVVECKPSRAYLDPEFRQWANAVAADFKSRGLRFVVVDEHDVCGWDLVANLACLWRVKSATELDARASRVFCMVEQRRGLCSVGAVRLGGAADVDIYRALVRGGVYCDLHRRIAEGTLLQLTPFGDRRDLLSKFAKPWTQTNLPPAPSLDLLPLAWAGRPEAPPAVEPKSQRVIRGERAHATARSCVVKER